MFKDALKAFRQAEPKVDAAKKHAEFQARPTPSYIVDWDLEKDGPIPVFTNNKAILSNKEGTTPPYLTDARFRLTDDAKEAKIVWLQDLTDKDTNTVELWMSA